MSDPARGHEHPSPHRARIGAAALLFGLAIGPAAWALQQMLGYGLSSHTCYPSDAPTGATPVGWSAALTSITVSGLVFLLLAIAGIAIALHAWRATREEKGGARNALPEVGEGRSRFLALSGVLAGSLFCFAILFDLAVSLTLRTCGTLPP